MGREKRGEEERRQTENSTRLDSTRLDSRWFRAKRGRYRRRYEVWRARYSADTLACLRRTSRGHGEKKEGGKEGQVSN